MTKKLIIALGASALAAAMGLSPAMAQVRGHSAVGSYDQQRGVYVQSSTYSGRNDNRYDARYEDDYYRDDDRYYEDDRRDYRDNRDGYYRSDDRYYEDRRYNDRYYSDRRDYRNDHRRGEVRYKRDDNTGELIAAAIVGGIIVAALSDNDDHKHYRNRSYHRSSSKKYKRSNYHYHGRSRNRCYSRH